MPSWTGYSCGKCKKRILWEGQDLYYSIGVPYISCEKCGTVNDRSYRRNEWDLMKWPKKIPVYITTVIAGSFLGAGSGLAVQGLAIEKLGLTPWGPTAMWALCGAVIGLLVFGRWQKKAIQESRDRLTDESYRRTLLSLRIAAGSVVDIKGSPTERVFPTARRMGTVMIWFFVVMAIFVGFAFGIEHFFPVN